MLPGEKAPWLAEGDTEVWGGVRTWGVEAPGDTDTRAGSSTGGVKSNRDEEVAPRKSSERGEERDKQQRVFVRVKAYDVYRRGG